MAVFWSVIGFKKGVPTSDYTHSLKLRNINITEDVLKWNSIEREMQNEIFNIFLGQLHLIIRIGIHFYINYG